MIQARWDNLIPFDYFVDHERETLGETRSTETDVIESAEQAKEQIKMWANNYYKNRWENQRFHVEVFIEKKALQGVFNPICSSNRVALNPCKGYPSLTFVHETGKRLVDVAESGKMPIILYFGDHDPSGEDIPRAIEDNIERMFGPDIVMLDRIMLTKEQVREMNLPAAPAKKTDTRSKGFTGIGQVELDAVPPKTIQRFCQDAIDKYFDYPTHERLMDIQREERKQYQSIIRENIDDLFN